MVMWICRIGLLCFVSGCGNNALLSGALGYVIGSSSPVIVDGCVTIEGVEYCDGPDTGSTEPNIGTGNPPTNRPPETRPPENRPNTSTDRNTGNADSGSDGLNDIDVQGDDETSRTVIVCHCTATGEIRLTVSSNALSAHLRHGDRICE